ncbi:14732_t:CDS:2, partial [Cetraspora pellucida]
MNNSFITNKDGSEELCNHQYGLTTGTGNLKAHLHQAHRILPPENNNNNSLNKIVSNQTLLHDFINKRILLLLSKQDKITSHVLAWICEPRFEFSCYDKLKKKLMQSVLFAKWHLKDLMQTTIDSFSFTIDLWSQVHQPYIGITIHWISPEFSLYQALLTIQKFDYPHTGCIAHRIQLALGDGFGIAEVDNLINKARTLNSHISGKDKYCEQLHRLQAELDPQHLINPLSSNTRTRWSSTYNLLKNLLFLCNAIICLADNLQQSVNQQERQDEMKILELMRSQYLTLGMMIPIIIKLSCHLQDFYPKITSTVVKACCIKINKSMLSRWSEPSPNSLVASFLDLKFKKMNFITSKTQSSSTNVSSFFSYFYDDDHNILSENEGLPLIEKEINLYDNLPQIPKYHITDEEY